MDFGNFSSNPKDSNEKVLQKGPILCDSSARWRLTGNLSSFCTLHCSLFLTSLAPVTFWEQGFAFPPAFNERQNGSSGRWCVTWDGRGREVLIYCSIYTAVRGQRGQCPLPRSTSVPSTYVVLFWRRWRRPWSLTCAWPLWALRAITQPWRHFGWPKLNDNRNLIFPIDFLPEVVSFHFSPGRPQLCSTAITTQQGKNNPFQPNPAAPGGLWHSTLAVPVQRVNHHYL